MSEASDCLSDLKKCWKPRGGMFYLDMEAAFSFLDSHGELLEQILSQIDILIDGRNDMRKAIAFAIQEDDAYNGIAFLEAWEQGNHLEEWPEYATFEVKP